jgi:hypothetical protein
MRDYVAASELDSKFYSTQLYTPVDQLQGLQFKASYLRIGRKGYETSFGVSYDRLLGADVRRTFDNAIVGIGLGKVRMSGVSYSDSYRVSPYLGVSGGSTPNFNWVWMLSPVFQYEINERPGGNRLGVGLQGTLNSNNVLGAYRFTVAAGLYFDQKPFSLDLFGDRRRRSEQIEVGFHQEFQTRRVMRPFLGLTWFSTKDRIPLFSVESLQVQAGLRFEL